MTISRKELDDLQFYPTHEWVEKGATVKARVVENNHQKGSQKKPMVYMWLTPLGENSDSFRLLYVGKAGSGISQRNLQHEGGFVNSKTGQKNLELIREVLSTKAPVLIYSRISDRLSILGQEISIYSAEEEALCARFSPEWNRAQFAIGAKVRNTTNEMPAQGGNSIIMTPATSALSEFDFSRLPRAEEIYNFLQSINQTDRDKFARLLDWAFGVQEQHNLEHKIILKYVNQPPGYNGIPTLVFARFGSAGVAVPDSWKVRIPLRSDDKYPLTVVLPTSKKREKVNDNAIVYGKHPNFRPLDLDDFLSNPSNYVCLAP